MPVMGCLGQAGGRKQQAGRAAMVQAKHHHLQQQPLVGMASFSLEQDQSGPKAAHECRWHSLHVCQLRI